MQTALTPYKKNEKWQKEQIKTDFLHLFKLGSRPSQKIHKKIFKKRLEILFFYSPCP